MQTVYMVMQWLMGKDIDKLDLAKYTENSKKGLILEVDLE